MAKSKAGAAAEKVAEKDAKLADAAGKHRDRLPLRILSTIAKLGDQPPLRLISGGLAAAGLLLGRPKLARAGVRMLLAHELATSAKDVIKNRIDRTRPNSASDPKQAKARPGDRTAKKHTSFPSGHSAGSVAVAQAFAREFPEQRVPALAAAAVVAVGQVPKLAHYPTDIAAGAILGAASEAALASVWPAADRETRETALQP